MGTDPFHGPTTIGIYDVLKAHFILVDEFRSDAEPVFLPGPRSLDLLGSAMGRQNAGFDGKTKWTEPLDLAATLFFGLVKNHAFHDGNKRTAYLTLMYHLQRLHRTPTAAGEEFEELTVAVAASDYSDYPQHSDFEDREDGEVSFISYFLRRNTRSIDKRSYIVTYRALRTILRQFGFDLDNPSGNFIDVIRISDTGSRLSKVAQIGFPGWTSEVNRGAIGTIRSECGLTPDEGIDSQVLFKGEDPFYDLLGEFYEPLARLRDR